VTDFFHEWRWQGKHMHTLWFQTDNAGQTFCPKCGDTYHPPQKRKSLKPESLYARDHERNQKVRAAQTTTTNTPTLPETPKQEVSRFAQVAFSLIFVALGGLTSAFICALFSFTVGVHVGLVIAGFALLTSISLGILSLRENL
jgi:hypothetical protein